MCELHIKYIGIKERHILYVHTRYTNVGDGALEQHRKYERRWPLINFSSEITPSIWKAEESCSESSLSECILDTRTRSRIAFAKSMKASSTLIPVFALTSYNETPIFCASLKRKVCLELLHNGGGEITHVKIFSKIIF